MVHTEYTVQSTAARKSRDEGQKKKKKKKKTQVGPGGRATAYCCLQANCRGQQPRGANANKYNSRTKTATTCCVDAQFCSPRRHGGAKMMILLHEESIENPV